MSTEEFTLNEFAISEYPVATFAVAIVVLIVGISKCFFNSFSPKHAYETQKKIRILENEYRATLESVQEMKNHGDWAKSRGDLSQAYDYLEQVKQLNMKLCHLDEKLDILEGKHLRE